MILHLFDIKHKVVILLDSASDTVFLYHFFIRIIIQWLVVWGLAALWDSISVYIGPSPRERKKEKKG